MPDKTGTIQPVDIGIVVALREELRELLDLTGGHAPDPYADLDSYLFSRGPYRCAVTLVGEMGSTQASLFTERLTARLDPGVILSIGIAGGVNDLLAGDVHVPPQAVEYIQDAKASPAGPGGFAIVPGAPAYRADFALLKAARGFEFNHPAAHAAWVAACADDLVELLPDDVKRSALIAERNIRSKVALLTDGHVATGPIVGAAKAFSNWIRSHDRQVKSLEMESAAVLLAAQTRTEPKRALAIRGISDFGDEHKKELDQKGDGVLRRYAMRNAVRLLWALLDVNALPLRPSSPAPAGGPIRRLPHTSGGLRSDDRFHDCSCGDSAEVHRVLLVKDLAPEQPAIEHLLGSASSPKPEAVLVDSFSHQDQGSHYQYYEVRGPIALESNYYVRRVADRAMESSVNAPRSFPYILEPRRTGKSSLVARALAFAKQSGTRTVYIDLDTIGQAELEKSASFARILAEIVAIETSVSSAYVNKMFSTKVPHGIKLTAVLDEILRLHEERILVALDHIDALLHLAWGGDFLRLVRAWHTKGSRSAAWAERFNVLLAGSSEPDMLISGPDSPFNVGQRIPLADFTIDEITILANAYRISADRRTIEAIKDLIGGHPEQTHRLLVHAANAGKSCLDMMDDGTAIHLFENDLRRARKTLDEFPELRAFLQRLNDHGAELNQKPAITLYWMGLLRREGARGLWRSRLYRDYLLGGRA
jgi:nucleoside phosphorylase